MISERLRELMAFNKITKEELAKKCDLPLETIRNIYYGKTNDPKVSTVMRIAKVFNLSVNCLMGECQHTPEERKLLQYYRQSGKHGKSYILSVAKSEATATKHSNNSYNTHEIKCLLPRGEIRKGIIYDQCDEKTIITHLENAFVAVQMTDDDLAPRFYKDDVIIFEDRFPENGEIAGFFKSDRAYIRRFVVDGDKKILKSLYSNYEDIILQKTDDIEYIGTCIDIIRA